MTICILRKSAGQNISRPYNRATDADEMIELLDYHILDEARKANVQVSTLQRIARGGIDTEQPVLHADRGRTLFYAFTEPH